MCLPVILSFLVFLPERNENNNQARLAIVDGKSSPKVCLVQKNPP